MPKVKVKEFASMRLTGRLRDRVSELADAEERSLSTMLRILVQEALNQREAASPEPAQYESKAAD